ncbi:hypothetical protein GP486_005793 [Trichoglossum hirsutum]|uniref:Velvet domain-containing protein n=1 Tax=Trichoglossum hirsutum TaxID=265104 RepID=A0A9P8L8J8_9PEZI|nr:hypothetical protein GP486_005793 [Trichoglossum hirsutum]
MPRGGGRRRTVSQSSRPRAPPRESGRRRATSTTPLRRSARLLSRSQMTPGSALITETVGRSSQSRLSEDRADLNARAAGAEVSRQRQRQRSRRERDAEEGNSEERRVPGQQVNGGSSSDIAQNSLLARNLDQSDNREQRYEMEIVVQPPAAARPGARLYPPITVRLRIRDSRTGEEIDGRDQLGRLWALASVVVEDDQVEPRPSGTHVLTGNLVDSAHPLYDDGDSPEADRESSATTAAEPDPANALGSYMTFPGLVLNEAGNFRIRITLTRMESGGTATTAVREGGLTLGEVRSRIVRIGDGSGSAEMTNDEQAFFESLRRRGIAVPSPPSSPP